MNVPSPKLGYKDQSRDTQVLRSIDFKTQSSTQTKSLQSQLMIKILMLSIEIDRKDNIIRELLVAANHNQYEIQIEELTIRCQKYQLEVKTLNQTLLMLKENISIIESSKNKEVFNSVTHQFNEELENKVYHLEGRLRKAEEERISLEEELKKNKLNQSMVEYKFIRNEQSEKGRVRELENLLITERTRADSQKKASSEKSLIIEDLKNRLMQGQANEKMFIQQYQEKLRMFQNQFAYHQNLKKSQIVSSEEKISASAQEIYRLSEQIKYLKQNLQNQRENLKLRQKQFNKMGSDTKQLQNKYLRLQGQLKEVNIRLESKMQQLRLREKQINDKQQMMKKLQTQTEEIKFYFNNKNEEIQIYTVQINRLKEELAELYHQNDLQKNQIRKLKRKPISNAILCESCKIKETGSSTMISSQKSIRGLNIDQIIHQTEQLFKSNRKMENLITKHQSTMESTIHVFNHHTYQ